MNTKICKYVKSIKVNLKTILNVFRVYLIHFNFSIFKYTGLPFRVIFNLSSAKKSSKFELTKDI